MDDNANDSQIINSRKVNNIIINSILDIISLIIIFQIVRSHLKEPNNNIWILVISLVLLVALMTAMVYNRIVARRTNYQKPNELWTTSILITAIVVYLLLNT